MSNFGAELYNWAPLNLLLDSAPYPHIARSPYICQAAVGNSARDMSAAKGAALVETERQASDHIATICYISNRLQLKLELELELTSEP